LPVATYTWNGQTTTDVAWAEAGNWLVSPSANGPATPATTAPGTDDIVFIRYGTVDLASTTLTDMTITLAPTADIGAQNVTFVGTSVELAGFTELLTGTELPQQPIVYDVIGSGTLDRNAVIDVSAAPLTIALAAAATFINNGNIIGDGGTASSLVITDAGGATPATLLNDGFMQVSAGLTIGAGATLGGSGTVDFDGAGNVNALIQGAVGAGQTLTFTNGPAGNALAGTLTIDNAAQFKGAIALDANHAVLVVGVTGSLGAGGVVFSNGSTLDIVPSNGATGLNVSASGSNTLIVGTGTQDVVVVATGCFHAGTRLATATGEAAVEDLRVGDPLRLARGGTAPVVWIGHRTLRCDRHPDPREVWPVRIRAGAFADAVPARDLRLSPDHAVAVDGHLIPVRHLTNGATIVQERAAVVRYYHVELARHDLLLSEGLASESYLDTGNRWSFEGGGPALALHPEFSRRTWATRSCLPLAEGGPVVAAARRLLLRRARRLGHRRTGDPGTSVLAGGQVLGVKRAGDAWAVRLPPGLATVRLLSRVWVPAELRPGTDDHRQLGVALGRLWLDRREVSLDSPALSQGWHPWERDGRWTDGDALLPVAGARLLSFTLTMVGRYWHVPEAATRRRG
jgi:hypothetical protein